MAVQIQTRRGTAAAWTSANPTLAIGEMGYETDTGKMKVGDGTTAWTSLPYRFDFAAAITTHSAAADPHGDRAYAASLVDDLSGVTNAPVARVNLGLAAPAQLLDGLTGAAFQDYPTAVGTDYSDLFRTTVAANSLIVPGSQVWLRCGGRITNNSGGDRTVSIYTLWGDGVAITAASVLLTASANARKWMFDMVGTMLYTDGTTNNNSDWEFVGKLTISTPGSGEWRQTLDTGDLVGQGLSVRSPYVSNDLVVQAKWDSAVGDPVIDMRSAGVVIIPAAV